MIARRRAGILAILALLAGMADVAAQDANYPARQIRMVVPWPAGGPADIIGRTLAASIARQTGFSFFIDNRGGANGNIGAEAVARASPDGYTIGLIASSHAANVSLYKNLPYDLTKDFSPVASLLTTPFYLVVHPALPARSVAELIALAKSKPGALSYGSAGLGGGAHVATELFKSLAKVDILHVPYKGTAPALVDVVGGKVDMMFASASGTLSLVKENRLRVLAMTGSARSVQNPEIPTVSEAGVRGYAFAAWFGVVAPAGMPKPFSERLNVAIAAAMKTPAMLERLASDGSEPMVMSTEGFGEYLPRQVAEWQKLVGVANIKGE